MYSKLYRWKTGNYALHMYEKKTNKIQHVFLTIIIKCFSSQLKRIIMRAVSKEASNKEHDASKFVKSIYKIAKSTCILVNKIINIFSFSQFTQLYVLL